MAAPTAFELSGGALCLDLANTWGDRGRAESDRLRDYEDLLAFCCQAGALGREDTAMLRAAAAAAPDAAAAALARARELRDTLYRIFAAAVAEEAPRQGDVERVNAALAGALRGLRLQAREGGFAWAWTSLADDLLAPLRPVLRSAAELLTSEQLARVRQCHGTACTWLFLDASRNRSRRWCSMETCGNRAKARRHYHRSRGPG